MEGKFVDENKKMSTDLPVISDNNTRKGLQNKTKELTKIVTKSEVGAEGTENACKTEETSQDLDYTELQSPSVRKLMENHNSETIGSPSPTLPRR